MRRPRPWKEADRVLRSHKCPVVLNTSISKDEDWDKHTLRKAGWKLDILLFTSVPPACHLWSCPVCLFIDNRVQVSSVLGWQFWIPNVQWQHWILNGQHFRVENAPFFPCNQMFKLMFRFMIHFSKMLTQRYCHHREWWPCTDVRLFVWLLWCVNVTCFCLTLSITMLPVSFLLTATVSLATLLLLQESFSMPLAQTGESLPLQRADTHQGISNWTETGCKSLCVGGDYQGSNQMGIVRKTPRLVGCTKQLTVTAPFCAVWFSFAKVCCLCLFCFLRLTHLSVSQDWSRVATNMVNVDERLNTVSWSATVSLLFVSNASHP